VRGILPEEGAARPAGYRSRNWPLILGSILVGILFILALIGPKLAPRDPLEMARILRVEEKFVKAPFPLFTPGYPLGSDDLGRDMLSRLLWAVRPTMTIVLIVAAVRLVLGIFIGLAGWSKGRIGNLLDSLIALAISIPVILVALGVSLPLGRDGCVGFVFGLCLTGWVETARRAQQTSRRKTGIYRLPWRLAPRADRFYSATYFDSSWLCCGCCSPLRSAER
jgi:ABC-type dipeptide/oligopeptide/nickel transport system permease subunit